MKNKLEIEISTWTILRIILVLLAVYLAWVVREIALLLFFVFILVATFSPVVALWEKKIKRLPAVLILLVAGIIILSFIIYIIAPPLVTEFKTFLLNAPEILNKYKGLAQYGPLKSAIDSIPNNINNYTGSFVNFTINIFGGIFAFLIAIVLTVYMLIDQKAMAKFAVSLFPEDSRSKVVDVAQKVADKVGDWFRGQLLLMLIIGLVDYIGLLIIGVPYALALAVVAAILEIVPTLGPIISGIIAAVVALSATSPIKALLVVILYVIVQQLESTVVVPKLMQKVVGLSPVIVIIAVLVGGKLLGVVGALIAVPLAASISVLISEWKSIKQIIFG